MITVRSTACTSSRTFPGHEYARSAGARGLRHRRQHLPYFLAKRLRVVIDEERDVVGALAGAAET